METKRVVIVDDEAPARRRLNFLIENETNWQVVAECANAKEAIVSINQQKPEIVFLDIALGDGSAFTVLQKIDYTIPTLVFVSAYDQFAIKAFDNEAFDFLLKPYSDDRFNQSIDRISRKTKHSSTYDLNELRGLIEGLPKRDRDYTLQIRDRNRIVLIKASEIECICSAGNYCEIFSGESKFLSRDSLFNLESKLAPYGFIRVHRKTIVNSSHIRELIYKRNNGLFVLLNSGKNYRVSASYEQSLKNRLNIK